MKNFLLLALLPLAQVAHAGPKIDVFLSMPLVAPAPLYAYGPPPVQYRQERRVIRSYEPQYYAYPTVIYNDYPRNNYYYKEHQDRSRHNRHGQRHHERNWDRNYNRDNGSYYYQR